MRSQRVAVLRIIVLAALPLIALSLLIVLQRYQARQRDAASTQLSLASSAALATASYLDGSLATLRNVSLSDEIVAAAGDSDRAERYLREIVAANPDWFGLSVVGSDGFTIAGSFAAPGSVSIADRPYFQQALASGAPVISPVVIGRLSGEPSLSLVTPIRLSGGEPGVLLAALPTARLERAIDERLGAHKADILLLDAEGTPIVDRTRERGFGIVLLPSWEPAAAARRGESGTVVADLDGQSMLAAYEPVRPFGWAVLVLRPAQSVFGPARRDLLESGALLGLALATVAGLGWYFSGRLTGMYGREVELRARAEAAQAEAESAHARASWLATVSEQLAGTLDYESTLGVVAHSAVPSFCDWCFLDLIDQEGRVRRVAVAHSDPRDQALADALRAYPPDPQATVGAGGVLRSGQPELMPGGLGEPVQYAVHGPEHARLVGQLGPTSILRVPIRTPERVSGVLSFVQTCSGRRFGAPELSLAQELSRRAALAIENARLYGEARGAIQVRDEFLMIASHELRTPLTSIKAAAQILLRSESQDRLKPELLRRLLDRINWTSDHLAELIGDLLDVSRLQTGRLPLRLEELDLGAFVSDSLARHAEQLDRRHQLTLDLPSVPCPVRMDPRRIEQVLGNLIDNAAKYSPGGGEIRVTIGLCGQKVRLEVADEGVGLPPGSEEAIFEPFRRAPSQTDDQAAGLGLGLYICRRIVEQHGGQMAAYSEGPGRGTTLRMSLPLAPAAVGSVA